MRLFLIIILSLLSNMAYSQSVVTDTLSTSVYIRQNGKLYKMVDDNEKDNIVEITIKEDSEGYEVTYTVKQDVTEQQVIEILSNFFLKPTNKRL